MILKGSVTGLLSLYVRVGNLLHFWKGFVYIYFIPVMGLKLLLFLNPP